MSFDYLDQDDLSEDLLAIVGAVPKRWGRMDSVSRLAVIEVGRVLHASGLLDGKDRRGEYSFGLIAGTRRGSLATDLAFAETLSHGLETASPILFSYTLANTALAEAASHYGITGPVYSIYSENPFEDAVSEAQRWLSEGFFQIMVAGALDYFRSGDEEIKEARFRIIR
ncbi:MAG: hypothetical protein KKE17_02275 [Proteobacteria bacterium]|nr:hypothetical protein [Pseudomonadota bacterium]MBU1708807.1 hypothetical protein [Pseudomonadota bacterium]